MLGQVDPSVQEPTEEFEDLTDLDLSDLLDVEVSLMSRRTESLWDAPGSVHVITRRDIDRSGLTSIPELLRLVPGVQVQQIGVGRWAISARGFANEFANKLLVQMDGRSLYTVSFSGVYWDVQDIVLDDIERIEVIRGPAAARWGANAVNGVINIVTRKASDTQGSYVQAIVGSEDRIITSFRDGFIYDDQTEVRLSGKFRQRASSISVDENEVGDGLLFGTANFRMDRRFGDEAALTVTGGASYLDERSLTSVPLPGAPFAQVGPTPSFGTGGYLVAVYDQTSDDGTGTRVQAYYDAVQREFRGLARVTRHSIDLDIQRSFAPGAGHRVTAGAGYRFTTDSIRESELLDAGDASGHNSFASAFLLYELEPFGETLRANFGVRLEHNDFTGLEVMPEARLSWRPRESTLIWASVARAVRTPTRTEDDATTIIASQDSGFGGLPLLSVLTPGSSRAEVLLAYELGARARVLDDVVVDANLYYFDYSRLNELVPGSVEDRTMTPQPSFVLPLVQSTTAEASAYGAEAHVAWQARPWWRLSTGYAFYEADIERTPGAVSPGGFGTTPRHFGLVRSSFDIGEQWAVDILGSTTVKFVVRRGWISTNEALFVAASSLTPSCSQMIFLTRSSMLLMFVNSSQDATAAGCRRYCM